MPHSALRLSRSISSDIFPGVFDWFFQDELFRRWCETRRDWQLHCIGGPGAGKTTLTALIHRHLIEHHQTQKHTVVSIYINRDTSDRDNTFVEDFLDCIYVQLGKSLVLEQDSSSNIYQEYTESRTETPYPSEGLRIKDRLSLLRRALNARLEALKKSRAFLLLDGIDRCSQTLRYMLDEELIKLIKSGLSVLVTSRLAVFEQGGYKCNHPNHGGDQPDGQPMPEYAREIIDVLYECRTCGWDICYPCRDAKRSCPNGDDDSELFEPYDHVNVSIAVPELAMKDFIAWDLEREHGDLGLGSSAHKPPLSPLGKSLLSTEASHSVQTHASNVFEDANGHIGMAKARLDVIHANESLEGIETRRDQLPANIVAMFDHGLRRIEKEPTAQFELAIQAIAAAASNGCGMSIPDLRTKLRNLDIVETRSGEDIVEATRGFLITTLRDDPQRLRVYHQSFFYYAAERYHQALHRASFHYSRPPARFEPQNYTAQPAKVTPAKLARSVTMQGIEEEAFVPMMITRKGTRAWK